MNAFSRSISSGRRVVNALKDPAVKTGQALSGEEFSAQGEAVGDWERKVKISRPAADGRILAGKIVPLFPNVSGKPNLTGSLRQGRAMLHPSRA
ncbi:MAG: hypothetical protein IJF17_02240 [Thermoguttaceae bacterium]|nr:hypothetical protein [Thermoguttaceae bacterium]